MFDRFPKLKLVIGHMGEMLPYQLERVFGATSRIPGFSKARSGRTFERVWKENIWITTSGMFTLAPMGCLLQTVAMDRIMLSVDYPFSKNEQGREFVEKLEGSGLVTEDELKDLAYRNAERLLGIKAVQFA